jgi:hypothetical protein
VNRGTRLLESFDQGDSVHDITPAGMSGNISAFAYGVDNPSAAYVGTSSGQLFLRGSGTGPPTQVTSYSGWLAQVNDIAVDRSDWRKAAIINADRIVLYTADAGATWTNIQGNVGDVLQFLRKIELIGIGKNSVVVIAGDPAPGVSGVGRTIIQDPLHPNGNAVWTALGTGLPRTLVFDLHYYPLVILQNGGMLGNVLLAGTLGRGAWVVSNAGDPCPQLRTAIDALTNQVDDLEQALAAGEIPAPPRTPQRIAAVRAMINRLRVQLSKLQRLSDQECPNS